MTDTVIKGSGNSRTLKTVPNAMAMYANWTDALQAMIDGTFPIDIGPLNAAGLNVQGTDLNKANLLTDALCTALGLATTATPTQAMEKIRAMAAAAQSTANGRVRIETKSYTGTGKYGEENPNSLTFSFAPAIVIFVGDDTLLMAGGTNKWFMPMTMLTTEYVNGYGFTTNQNGNGNTLGKKSADGKTIYWYNNYSSQPANAIHFQCNVANRVYKFIGIG